MGKANKQRRAAKQKVRRAAASRRDAATPRSVLDALFEAGPPPLFAEPTLEESVIDLLDDATRALNHGDREMFDRIIGQLAARPSTSSRWVPTVERSLTMSVRTLIGEKWRMGWQPMDVVRLVWRRLGARHERMVRDVIADQMRGYAAATVDPRWTAQLDECGVKVWWRPEQTYLRAWRERDDSDTETLACLVEVAHMLHSLPKIETLAPIPGQFHASAASAADTKAKDVDARILSRVRALLAKAESTTFPAEAETFTAGAQALMARHSIDAALLAATDPSAPKHAQGRRIGIDNPYEASKVMLLASVARANRCRTVWSKEFGFNTVVGFTSDLDAVETLFTSLLVQAIAALNREGARAGVGARARSRGFRQSFLTAYATRIGERLSQATAAAQTEAAAESGTSGTSLVPVLAARDQAVDDAVDAMFSNLTYTRAVSVSDWAGYTSGLTAADLAGLERGAALPG